MLTRIRFARSLGFVLVIALSLAYSTIASADPGPLKKTFIADARHFALIEPGADRDATFGDGIEATASGSDNSFSARAARGAPRNTQINDPNTDYILTFPGTRPFEFSTQSETSIARAGSNLVVGFNSSAGAHVVSIGGSLFFDRIQFSGVASSQDGGKTWTSGFVPTAGGDTGTFGDPSLVADRAGNFYYASLGEQPTTFNGALIVNKSTDGGRTFGTARVVAVDNGSDKEWLAVGRDPQNKSQDNLYLVWTSFGTASSELRFTRSTDGGATWSAQKTIFAPVDNGVMSSFVQFANPVVDPENGRLYVPFLHFSNSDADAVRVLVSNDGGATFSFLAFNEPGAVDANAHMVVSPGTLVDCGRGAGGFRLVLRSGPNIGGGRFGLPRYTHATRLVTQPAAAVIDGTFAMAINSSTSPSFGDPASGSRIDLLFSRNGGASWKTATVAASTAADPQHVHPAVTMDDAGNITVAYYVQQANGDLRVDSATGTLGAGNVNFKRQQVSNTTFGLAPSMFPIPSATNPFRTTNYDRIIQPCYSLGEYMSITGGDDVRASWGDSRNPWTSPAGSPAAGTHPQADVFFANLAD